MAISVALPYAALLAIAVLPGGSDAAPQASDVELIQTGEDRHQRLTVPVTIGSSGPYEFMVDTGSQHTVLATSLATKLGIPLGRKAKLTGVAGSEMVDTVELDEIALGKRSYYGLLAPLLDRSDIGAEGIIGLDSLQGQRVQFDFRKGLLAVADAQALGGNRGYEIVVTARRRSGQLIMTQARIDGIRVQVVIDTGSDTSIRNRALQRQLSRRGQSGQMTLRSVTGQEIVADIGFARGLTIDQVTFANVLVAYADSPHFPLLGLDKQPTLFLGMRDLRQLDRVAIDFASRRIYFDIPETAASPNRDRADSLSFPLN